MNYQTPIIQLITNSVTSPVSFYRGEAWTADTTILTEHVVSERSQEDQRDMLRLIADKALGSVSNQLDSVEVQTAVDAIRELIDVLGPAKFSKMPWIGVSDEGAVIAQWERGEQGVSLFFAGDDTFGYSTRSGPEDHHTSSYLEQPVSNGLPVSLAWKIMDIA